MWSEGDEDLFDDFSDSGPGGGGDARQDSSASQRSFGRKNSQRNDLPMDTQRRDRVVVNYNDDTGEAVEPSNEFEKMLLREGIEVRRDENYRKYLHIGDSTSDALVAKLEMNMHVRRYKDDLLTALEEALKQRSNLQTYLEPSHSDGQTSLDLSHLCIAQIRFITRIYHSRALFSSVFERDFVMWAPEIRNALITSIPEVLTDVSVQLEAVRELQKLLLGDVKSDPVGCKLAVISALALLNSNDETSKKMQAGIISALSDFEVELLPSVIELLLRRLDSDSKGAFASCLSQISAHLQVEQLKVSRRGKLRLTPNDIVGETLEKIAQYVVLGGDTRWKEVQKFFKSGGSPDKRNSLEAGSQEAVATPDSSSSQAPNLFVVLLSVTLLGLRTCPLSVANTIKQRFVQCQDSIDTLNELFGKALKFKSLCERNVNSIIAISQQCLWSTKVEAKHFGAKLLREIFVSLPKHRELVLKTLLSHTVQSDGESEAVLREFSEIVESNSDAVEPFVGMISKYFFVLERMSLNNVKRFFRAVLRLYAARPQTATHKSNLNVMIPLFLRSANNAHLIFGVVGALIKLETALLLENSTDREDDVRDSLKLIDDARSSSTYVRVCCYTELAEVLRVCNGCSRSAAMSQWLTVFIEEFRSDFFTESHVASSDLECDRYVNSDTKLWLKCSDGQSLGEAIPLLEAVMEAIRLQEKWPSADTMEASQRDRWFRILFALNANVSIEDVEPESKEACDKLFRVIQWIRTLFNVFAEEKACQNVDCAVLDELWSKKFLLMFECQKQLHNKVKAIGQWTLPDRTPLSMMTIVATELKKKPSKRAPKRKRARQGDDAEPVEDILPPTQALQPVEGDVKRCSGKSVALARMISFMKTMRLPVVVKLLKLMQEKRRATIFLTEHLLDILLLNIKFQLMQEKRRATIFLTEHLLDILKQICPRIGKRTVPWATCDASVTGLHGDVTAIFNEVEKLLPILWSTFAKTVSYFRDLLNSSAVITTEQEVVEQLAELFRLCLATIEHLFSWNHLSPLPSDSDAVTSRKRIRREKLMEMIEHRIIQEDGERNAGSEAEASVYRYLVDICDIVPNVGVALTLLDCVSVFLAPSEELNNKMARHTLGFLKREWTDREGKPIKGATLTTAVRKILSHYLRLRPVNYRLCAIQWILAKKLAELVPHEEKRKSKVYEQDSYDPDLNERDTSQIFACFTRATFGTIYKVLFVHMNDALSAELGHSSELVMRRAAVDEYLRTWSIAAGCVSLFGLMLRVRELRSTSLLVTAIKEGRRFLSMMCNKSSTFMYLLEDKSRLARVTDHVVEIIKSVQIGNRNFQNICVHAKANRSNILLKLVPDFRVTNERWMRAIQVKFAGINCQDAFEIGLLKSRDINGEEIVYSGGEESCSSTCSDTEPEPDGTGAQSDSDKSNTSEVF
ncbi:hypothetical protein Q1695_005819 [Nippostrongylus brasiliensis]|nr:hypothetical protein Q1695_005819 [Nippostrongylus brasiliensis]